MIASLADEDFNGRSIRGLLRQLPELDLVTTRGVGLASEIDATIVTWASDNGHVLLTHDVNTMIDAVLHRVRAGLPMPGLVAVPQDISLGAAIADLALIATCVEPNELEGQVWYLPLQ